MKNSFEKNIFLNESEEESEKKSGESEENQENQKEISSSDELEILIGAEIAEINNYYNRDAEDWIQNFKSRLRRIDILANSREAKKFLNKNIPERISSKISALIENLDDINLDNFSEEKNILLEKLNDLFD